MWDNALEDKTCIMKGNYEPIIFLNMNKSAKWNIANKMQQVIGEKKRWCKEWFNIGKDIDIFNGLKN